MLAFMQPNYYFALWIHHLDIDKQICSLLPVELDSLVKVNLCFTSYPNGAPHLYKDFPTNASLIILDLIYNLNTS